ncbi:hypothetical protein CFP56_019142 [Quercus suber]|uniref:Uncharacterized protein n=1 Tax=Quercus suber TaxID=58331 RepID=A0AAW0M2D6_QUESU
MKVLFFALNVTLCFRYSYALLAIAGDPYRAYTTGILRTISAFTAFFLEAMIRLSAIPPKEAGTTIVIVLLILDVAYFLWFCYFCSHALDWSNLPALERVRLSGLLIQSWEKK